MRVATFNVNSIRARMPILERWLAEATPDVVAVQETKVEDGTFPHAEIEALGYVATIHGQKSYNGVAFLSKVAPTDVATGFGDPDWPEDRRIIRGVFNGVLVINTYVPNGTAVGSEKFAYKLAWLERFAGFQRDVASGGPALWLGDINIAPTDDDVYEPDRHARSVGFQQSEKDALARLMEFGWTDVFRRDTPGSGHYTFWEFVIPNGFKRNLGWRIDHVYASPELVYGCSDCVVDREPRGWERPSDHTPVLVTVA